MSQITIMGDLFLAIKEVSGQVKKLDTRLVNVEKKMKEMKDELKRDIRKVD